MDIIKTRPKMEAAILSGLVVSLICFLAFLIYSKSVDVLEKEIKIGLLSNVSAAATTIDGDLHKTFDKSTARDDPDYLAAIRPLEKIRQASANIRYIYTNILKGDDVFFILNPSPQNDNDGDGQPDVPPALMERYDDAAPELIEALKSQKKVVSDPYTDKWGTFISAYAPFYDAQGAFVGVLGMDLQLNDFYSRIYPIRLAFEKTAFIVVFIGLIIGLLTWISRKYAAFLGQQNAFLQSRQAQRGDHLALVKQNFIDLLEVFAKTPQKDGLTPLIKVWLEYLKSTEALVQDKENFRIDALMDDVKARMLPSTSLTISTDEAIPPVLLADKNVLQELLVICCTHIGTMAGANTVTLDIKRLDEAVDSLTFAMVFKAQGHHPSEGMSDRNLEPEYSKAELYSVQDLEFFKAVAAVKAMGGHVSWQEDTENNENLSLSLELPISKYEEDNAREAAE
ncbi:PDC sensor domain-containing protein [Cohaesibacter marisflavi]|uniref:PDC sensor domain-containing protein n=1 Tax=Cohaesibacter marisflavi TaxID=655353 RepID=UPI0029C7C178|nr:PDC sensor domain-containing protein [Cohaesibacter marisflavi]